jgi:hypothetical protein
MLLNNAFIFIYYINVDEFIALSGNDGLLFTKKTNFLQYFLKSDETFISDEYIRIFAKAPFLSFYTINGSSNFSRQEYEAIIYARAPLLRFYTINKSSNISAKHEYKVIVLNKAPLFAFYTINKFSSYQHYKALA